MRSGSTIARLAGPLVAGLAIASPCAARAADCTPQTMVRIVTRDATPGIAPGSFAAQPKVLYRVGSGRGRIEEAPDPEQGIHGLIVVNEPDVWIVNRYAKAGQHVVDPGPSFFFRAPVILDPDLPAPLRELEMGCETAFIREYAPRPDDRVDLGGGLVLDRHQVTRGAHCIAILVDAKSHRVHAVAHYRDGKVARVIRYLEYTTGLPPDDTLFARPPGIAFTEAAPVSP